MQLKVDLISANGIKIILEQEGRKIGRGFLYVLHNDLHPEPFGLMEDIFIEEEYRGRGYGEQIVKAVIQEAKIKRCYKLICTSRFSNERAHNLYEKLGFKSHGSEFRMDF